MTDSDGYFSPRNHPQRLVYLPEDPELSDSELSDPEISDSEMGEHTRLFPDPKLNLPSPPYALGPRESYGTAGVMGNENSFDAAPPYTGRTNVPHVCVENCVCGARASAPPQDNPPPTWRDWARSGAIWGFYKNKKEYSVSGIAKWLFIRISFVVLSYFLLSEVLDVHESRAPRGRTPPDRKGPSFFQCSMGSGKGYFVERKNYTFPDPPSFSFKQISTQRSGSWDHGQIQVFGDVFVNGVQDLDSVTVDFEFKLSEESLRDRLSIEATDSQVIFKTDRTPHNNHYACIEVRATISVPLSKPAFGDFSVNTESLDITLEPTLDLDVDSLSLLTLSGDVTAEEAYGVDSQETWITAESGDITGDFGLFDLVHLVTKAGNIAVNIIPQESSIQKAEYIATTISGSIKTTFPKDTASLPKGRIYHSTIDTTSGSISGNYLLGESLSISSVGGSISQISVTATGEENSTLNTDSRSGSTSLFFTNSLGSGNKGLNAKHSSISGSVRVEYPADWEGVATGKSMTGSVSIKGHGVVIVDDTRWPAGRFVRGMKGAGIDGGSIDCNVASGSISIHVVD